MLTCQMKNSMKKSKRTKRKRNYRIFSKIYLLTRFKRRSREKLCFQRINWDLRRQWDKKIALIQKTVQTKACSPQRGIKTKPSQRRWMLRLCLNHTTKIDSEALASNSKIWQRKSRWRQLTPMGSCWKSISYSSPMMISMPSPFCKITKLTLFM